MRSIFVILVTASAVAGCTAPGQDKERLALEGGAWFPDEVVWDTTGPYSATLESGPFAVLPPEIIRIRAHDGTALVAAVWRPDVPDGRRVPVILDAGPYFHTGIDNATRRAIDQYFFIQNFVPHGFAYGHLAVRGTSSSAGCMEFFSANEQRDIDTAITQIAALPWTNGNVGLVGISYDGTTQWEAATFSNPHLKTIVPMAGITSVYDQGFRNGTGWAFAPVFHGYYWAGYGFNPVAPRTMEDRLDNLACPEAVRGLASGAATTFTGDRQGIPGVSGDYWTVRDFRDRVLRNYRGSVFLVHGFLDGRVPISQSFPFAQELQRAGVPTKMLMGQWWHDQPDRAARLDHLRWDFAESLLRWFDTYLNGGDGPTGAVVDVEDNQGLWRTEASWPPTDASWTQYYLGAQAISTTPPSPGEAWLFNPGALANSNSDRQTNPTGTSRIALKGQVIEYWASLGRLDHPLRIAGLPRLHATFVPSSPEGSRIYAELIDVGGYQERTVLGYALMDLRYFAGGYDRHSLTPGAPIKARMEFFPMDVLVPAGHELAVRIVNGNGYSEPRTTWGYGSPLQLNPVDNFLPEPTPHPIRIQWGADASVLILPEIQRDVGAGRYPGQP